MATALVTGANRGIGLEICRQLKQRGDSVIAVCRRSSPELDGLGVRVEHGIDVTQPGSLADLAGRLNDVTLDLLVNNAGILRGGGLDNLDTDTIREQFDVNALGPLRTVHALLHLFAKPAKVALITSRMGSIADNTSGGMYGYRMSKAALNMAGVSLAYDLKDRDVAVAILHPGYVQTDMTGGNGNVTPAESAASLIQRMDQLSLENSGTFWHAQGEVLPW